MVKHYFLILVIVIAASYQIAGQPAIVPIVELKLGGLLGGVQNGKWIAATKMRASMKTETEFVLVGWNGVEEGGVTWGKKAEQEDVCEDFTRMDLELGQDHGVAVGSAAQWNPMPRKPVALGLESETYKRVASNFLKKRGIANPVVRIKQAYRIDLEGDGSDEVLLSATYYKDGLSSHASAGDYSFVVVRKAQGKLVKDFLLEGDFVTRKVVFGAPAEHQISAISDLNGDGIMEIVLSGRYYEGEFASVFEMKNSRPVEIKEFEIGCGV